MRGLPRKSRWPFLLAAGLAVSCGTSSIKPIAAADPEVSCPGGMLAWNLQISDQRADRRDSSHLVSLLEDSFSKSFPGCKWTSAPGADAATITIEIHRFGARVDENLWEAAAEWTVSAKDPSGRPLTEFQAESIVSRPNYRGYSNDVEALRNAFEQAMTRTLAGLRAISRSS